MKYALQNGLYRAKKANLTNMSKSKSFTQLSRLKSMNYPVAESLNQSYDRKNAITIGQENNFQTLHQWRLAKTSKYV